LAGIRPCRSASRLISDATPAAIIG
jgi:hypothetical protein